MLNPDTFKQNDLVSFDYGAESGKGQICGIRLSCQEHIMDEYVIFVLETNMKDHNKFPLSAFSHRVVPSSSIKKVSYI
jgi:hypothetical protein